MTNLLAAIGFASLLVAFAFLALAWLAYGANDLATYRTSLRVLLIFILLPLILLAYLHWFL